MNCAKRNAALLEGYAALAEDKATRTDCSRETRFPLLAAYELCLKCSHLFNILDARGAISVTERVGVIARMRALAVGCQSWVDQQRTEPDERSNEAEPASEKKKSKKEALAGWFLRWRKRQNLELAYANCDLRSHSVRLRV